MTGEHRPDDHERPEVERLFTVNSMDSESADALNVNMMSCLYGLTLRVKELKTIEGGLSKACVSKSEVKQALDERGDQKLSSIWTAYTGVGLIATRKSEPFSAEDELLIPVSAGVLIAIEIPES